METKLKTGLEAVPSPGGEPDNGKRADAPAAGAEVPGRVVLLYPAAGRKLKEEARGRHRSAGSGIAAVRNRRRLEACKYGVLLPWIPLVIYARCFAPPEELHAPRLPGPDSPLLYSFMVGVTGLLLAVYLQQKAQRPED